MATEFSEAKLWDATLVDQYTSEWFQSGEYIFKVLDDGTIFFNDPRQSLAPSPTMQDLDSPSYGWQSIKNHLPSPSPDVHQIGSSQGREASTSPYPITLESPPPPQTKRWIRLTTMRDRRREQNRAAQAAFRERSKLKIVELETQLSNCVVYNQNMHGRMRDLFERLEALRGDLVDALATGPPASPAVSSL